MRLRYVQHKSTHIYLNNLPHVSCKALLEAVTMAALQDTTPFSVTKGAAVLCLPKIPFDKPGLIMHSTGYKVNNK